MKVKALSKIVLEKFEFYKWQAVDGNTFAKGGIRLAVFASSNTKQFHVHLFTKETASVRLVPLSILLDIIEGKRS